MYTYQMVGVADHNTRVYESKYGTYSKFTGFILSELAKSISTRDLIYKLLHEDCWSLKNTKNIQKEYSFVKFLKWKDCKQLIENIKEN